MAEANKHIFGTKEIVGHDENQGSMRKEGNHHHMTKKRRNGERDKKDISSKKVDLKKYPYPHLVIFSFLSPIPNL